MMAHRRLGRAIRWQWWRLLRFTGMDGLTRWRPRRDAGYDGLVFGNPGNWTHGVPESGTCRGFGEGMYGKREKGWQRGSGGWARAISKKKHSEDPYTYVEPYGGMPQAVI